MKQNAIEMTGRHNDLAPFWEFYAIGDSALLAYHSCDGTEHKRVTNYDFATKEFACRACGERHADNIYGEAFLRDVNWDAGTYPN